MGKWYKPIHLQAPAIIRTIGEAATGRVVRWLLRYRRWRIKMHVNVEEIKVVMVDMTGEVVSGEDYGLSDMVSIAQALAVVIEDGVPIENATLVKRSDGDGLPENVMGAFLWSADTESMNKARLELTMRGKTWVGFKRG